MSPVTAVMMWICIIWLTITSCYFLYKWKRLQERYDAILLDNKVHAQASAAVAELKRQLESKDCLIVQLRSELSTLKDKLNQEARQVTSLVERLNAQADKLALVTARRDMLEELTTSQEYSLREYRNVLADPKSVKEFISWQAQRRQQDELLNILSGQSSQSQVVVEESQELTSRIDQFAGLERRRLWTTPIAGLTPVIPDQTIPSHDENAKHFFTSETTTVSSTAQVQDQEVQQASDNKYSSGPDTTVPEAN